VAVLVGLLAGVLKAQTLTWQSPLPNPQIPLPNVIGAHEEVQVGLVVSGLVSEPTTADVILDLGVYNNLTILGIVSGGSVTHLSNGTTTTLTAVLANGFYTIQNAVLRNGDVLEFKVSPRCGLPYVDSSTEFSLAECKARIAGGVDAELTFSIAGPQLSIDPIPGADQVLYLADPNDGIPITVRNLIGGLAVVPGEKIFIKYTSTGNSLLNLVGLTFIDQGTSVPIQATAPQTIVIETSSDLYAQLLSGDPIGVELLFDLAPHCNVTATTLFQGSISIGWNRQADPLAALCDESDVPLDPSLEPEQRTVKVAIDANWTLLGALNDCAAGPSESNQYFRIPYVITNTGSEPVKIRRIQLSRDGNAPSGVTDIVIGLTPQSLLDVPQSVLDVAGTGTLSEASLLTPLLQTTVVNGIAETSGFVLAWEDRADAIELAAGQSITVGVGMRLNVSKYQPWSGDTDPVEIEAQLSCPPSEPSYINNYAMRVHFDWECETLENKPGSNLSPTAPDYAYCRQEFFGEYNVALGYCDVEGHRAYFSALDLVPPVPPSTVTTPSTAFAKASMYTIDYVGTTHNVTSACFLPVPNNQMNWDVEFDLPAEDLQIWPALGSAGEEKLALELVLEKYLYLTMGDLLGSNPITVTLADGTTVYSTNPVGPQFPLVVVGSDYCDDLSCPSDSGALDGWNTNTRLLLEFPDFGSWNMPSNGLVRSIQRLKGARIKVPLRMHCPRDAGATDCDDRYVEGCDFSPQLSSVDLYASPTPRYLKVALVHLPNTDCGDPCDLPPVKLACGSKMFYVRCPGCTRVGIHNNTYSIERLNYGAPDANSPSRIADNTDYERDRDDIGVEPVRRDLAMAGDLLWSELHTTIETNVPEYGPWTRVTVGNSSTVKVPEVDLTHLYFKTAFNPGNGAVVNAQNTLAVRRVGSVLKLNDPRLWVVHLGDVLQFSPIALFPPDGKRRIVGINRQDSTVTLDQSVNLVENVWYHPVISTPLVTPVEVEMEFLTTGSPQGTPFTRKIILDLTLPELSMPGNPARIVYLDRDLEELWMFDLSPSTLKEVQQLVASAVAEVVPSPDPDPSFDYLVDDFNFTETDDYDGSSIYDGMQLNIRVKWLVATNIGPTQAAINVSPHAFLTTRPSQETGELFLTDFVEDPVWFGDPAPAPGFPDDGFSTILASPTQQCQSLDPSPCDIDNFMYFCTKAGGGFNLVGYQLQLLAGYGANNAPCDHGPGMWTRFAIGETLFGDAFPNEFRNWFCYRGARSAFNATSPNWTDEHEEWTSMGVKVEEPFPGLAVVAPRDINHLFTAVPTAPLERNELTTDVLQEVGAVTTMQPNELALSDDGFSGYSIRLRYAASPATATGPYSVPQFTPNHYRHNAAIRFRMDPAGRLPCPSGTLRQSGSFECLYEDDVRIRYDEPVLELPFRVLAESSGPLAQFSPFEVELKGSGPLPYVWVDLCEGDNTYEGFPVEQLTWSQVPINSTPIDPDQVGYSITSFLPPPPPPPALPLPATIHPLIENQRRRITITAQAPCAVEPTGTGERVAKDLLRTTWSCVSDPPLPVFPACPVSFPLVQSVPPEPQVTTVLELQPRPRDLEVQSITIEPQGCGYEVVARFMNPSVPATAVTDIQVGFTAPDGWTYVLGSSAIGVDNPGLNSDEGPYGLPDPEQVSATQSCGGTHQGWWISDPALCPQPPCAPLSVFDPLIGLPAGSTLVVSFNIEPAGGDLCSALLGELMVYVGSSVACDYPCSDAMEPLPAPPAPSTTLSLGPVGPCDQGATLTVSVDAAQLALPQVVLVDIPDGLQVIDGPQDLCSGSTFTVLPNGDVEWTIATTTTPCSLQLQVGYVSCADQAAYTITAGLQGGCCQAEVPFQGGEEPPCGMSMDITTTPSACGAPGQVLCGAWPAAERSVTLEGQEYRFVDIGAVLVAQGPGAWVLTGELYQVSDPNSRYWLQVYLNTPVDDATWTGAGGQLNGTVPTGEEWTIYTLSQLPGQESVLVGLGPNTGRIYDLAAEVGYGFQVGLAANTLDPFQGANLRFTATLRGPDPIVWVGEFYAVLECTLGYINYSTCSGSISGVVSGGTAPFTVQLTGPYVDQTIVSTDGTYQFDALCNNDGYADYVLTVTDATGCVQVTGGLLLQGEAPPMVVTVNAPTAMCAGTSACAVAEVTGGQSPYAVQWWWQALVESNSPITGAPGVPQCDLPTNEELWVVVTDANGCFSTHKFFITQLPNQLSLDASATLVDCWVCDGAATVAVSGFNGSAQDLTYLWTPGGQTTETITDLCPGEQQVTVTDAAGCKHTTTVNVVPSGAVNIQVTGVNPSCANGSNGSATVVVLDAHGPYTILWGNGASTPTITGLGAGTYQVTVTTPMGCKATGTVVLTSPPAMSAGIGYSAPTCSVPCNGWASATVTNNQGAVTYLWSTGATTLSVSNVCPGPLSVTITDAAGCTATQSVTIPTPNGTCAPSIVNCSNLLGLNKNTATISSTTVAGATNYQYLFTDNCSYNRSITTGSTNTTLALSFASYPLTECNTYRVKSRAMLNGVWGAWGPECTLTTSGCPVPAPRQLVVGQCGSSPTSPIMLTRSTFLTSVVQEKACKYYFKLTGITVPTYVKQITTVGHDNQNYYPNNRYSLNYATNPVVDCHVYKVEVKVEVPNTNGVPQWTTLGSPCYIRIQPSGGGSCPALMPLEPGAEEVNVDLDALEFQVFPNPNADGVLNIVVAGLGPSTEEATITLMDVMGRTLRTEQVVPQEGGIVHRLVVPDNTAPGVYAVRVTVGDRRLVRNVVLE
jgi:hypothetical protein